MRLATFHLPDIASPPAAMLTAGSVSLEHALLSRSEMASVLGRLSAAAVALGGLGDEELAARLAAIAAVWRDPHSDDRRAAEAPLATVTGFSAEMLRVGLARHFEGLTSDALLAWMTRARQSTAPGEPPHGIVALVLSGNLPGIGILPTMAALALRQPVFVKSASGDPLFPALFAESVAAIDPALGSCLGVAHWHGGSGDAETELLSSAALVHVFGGDATIAAIRPRCRGRVVAHGHKVSFALVDADSIGTAARRRIVADRLALDVALWDQQGCLSPQLCYVVGDAGEGLDAFAYELGEALDRVDKRLPAHDLSLTERAAVARFRDEAEWTDDCRLLAPHESVAWTVRIERDSRFVPSCLNRCVRILPLTATAALGPLLQAHRPWLEACGVAVSPACAAQVDAELGAAGVPYRCALGEMQTPPLAWATRDWFGPATVPPATGREPV